MTSLSTFLPMHLLPWIWISMSSQAWTPRVAWCHRSTQVQSYFCCCRLLTGFPIWTLDLHTGCIVCSPTYPAVILVPSSFLGLWNSRLLATLQQQLSLSFLLPSSFSSYLYHDWSNSELSTYFSLKNVKSSGYSLMGGQRAGNNTWSQEFRSQVFLDCHLVFREKEKSRNSTCFLPSPLQVSLQSYNSSTTYI